MSRRRSVFASGEMQENNTPAQAAVAPWPARRHVRASASVLATLLLTAMAAHAQFGKQQVGVMSGAQGATVTSQAQGTVAKVEVLSLGASTPEPGASVPDFAQGIGTSTCGTATFSAAGETCTESVTFTPAAPGRRIGAVVLLDGSGDVLGTGYLSGTGTGGLGVLVPGNLLPVAGSDGNYLGSVADGQPATQAELYLPGSIALDGAGNLYIADNAHNRIRMVCASATSAIIKGTSCAGPGIISTIAGNGNPAYTGDGDIASDPRVTLNAPGGITLDGAGNLYIADTGNSVIRVITAATGVISTIAGNGKGCAGQKDSVGDNCPAAYATFDLPEGVTLDPSGNLYIADTSNQRIRMITAATGVITTIAGNGFMTSNGSGGFSGDAGLATAAELNFPYAVAFDPNGNMYIPDSANNRVREVAAASGQITAASMITTFAGNGTPAFAGDGAAANLAELWAPSGVAVDPAGNVYIADTQNNAIRKVSSTKQFISTLVKNAVGTYHFNGGFNGINLYGPTGLYLDGSGDLYIADTLDMVVREIQSNYVALDYISLVRQGSQSSTQSQTIENDGNATLDLTAPTITVGTNAALDDTVTTCPMTNPFLAQDADCVIGAIFAPTIAGSPVIGNINAGTKGDAINTPLDIQVIGDATTVNSTTIAIASSLNPSGFGQSVTFTATVTTGSSTGSLAGTVSFFDGTTTLAANVPVGTTTTAGTNATASASFSTSTLAVGLHSITVTYNNANDPTHSTSTSAALSQKVIQGTVTTLASSLNPSALNQNVTFTATVTASAGGGVTPDGSITFMDGTTILANVALTGSVATYSTATLTQGAHSITAVYGGDSANEIEGSTSAALTQDVQVSSTDVLTSLLNPSTYGTPVTFTVTVASSGSVAATGTVSFLDGGVKIGTGTLAGNPAMATLTTSTLIVATHTITATYAGDANNAASNAVPLSQVVNQEQTATLASATPTPGIAGAAVAITATVKATTSTAIPTGTVTFTSGTTVLGTAPLGASGTATITPTLAPGQYSIVESYGGDANNSSSTSVALPLTVTQATTQAAVTVTPNPVIVGATVTFTAKVTGNGGTPTGTVTFSANGTPFGTPATLDATSTATIGYAGLAAGSHTITAVYSGDTNDLGSTGTASAPLVIGTIATTTDLGSSTTTGSNPQVILVAAVLSASGAVPTGTVTFNNGTTAVGTATLDSSGVATLTPNLANGSYTIVAVYSGDALHSASTSQPVTITAGGTTFNLTIPQTTVTMQTSQNVTMTVTLSSTGGFADTIGLGCASLPVGVTCHFSPITVPLAANGTATDQLTIDTNNPLSGGASAMNAQGNSRGTYLAGILLPFSRFFGWIFWSFRRRHTGFLTMVLVALLTAGALLATGCSGFSMGSVAPGTYVIQVTGTGASSDVVHYQNVTLDITN